MASCSAEKSKTVTCLFSVIQTHYIICLISDIACGTELEYKDCAQGSSGANCQPTCGNKKPVCAGQCVSGMRKTLRVLIKRLDVYTCYFFHFYK